MRSLHDTKTRHGPVASLAPISDMARRLKHFMTISVNVGRVADALLREDLMKQRKKSRRARQAEPVHEEEVRWHNRWTNEQRRCLELEMQWSRLEEKSNKEVLGDARPAMTPK